MKKTVALLIIVLSAFAVSAQEASFEALDSLSVIIADLEKQTDGKAYKDEKGDIYTLNFPGENFKTYFYDKLANKAVYKSWGNREVLALTENIDFTKATGISVGDDYNGVAYIRLDFPEGHLKTQIIEDGVLVNTINEKYLEFFCRYGAVDENKQFYFEKMLNNLYSLCTSLKIEKGMMTEDDVKKETEDWDKLSSEEYIRKYPKSLMRALASQIVEKVKMEVEKKQEKSLYNMLIGKLQTSTFTKEEQAAFDKFMVLPEHFKDLNLTDKKDGFSIKNHSGGNGSGVYMYNYNIYGQNRELVMVHNTFESSTTNKYSQTNPATFKEAWSKSGMSYEEVKSDLFDPATTQVLKLSVKDIFTGYFIIYQDAKCHYMVGIFTGSKSLENTILNEALASKLKQLNELNK